MRIRNGTIVMMFIWVSILLGKDDVPAGPLDYNVDGRDDGGHHAKRFKYMYYYYWMEKRKNETSASEIKEKSVST